MSRPRYGRKTKHLPAELKGVVTLVQWNELRMGESVKLGEFGVALKEGGPLFIWLVSGPKYHQLHLHGWRGRFTLRVAYAWLQLIVREPDLVRKWAKGRNCMELSIEKPPKR